MEVFFGRENGQQTSGVVVKINGKKAKVQISEGRGKFPAGTVWSVPYSMLEAKNGENPVIKHRNIEPIVYSPFQDQVEQFTLEAIACCYNKLSPENLCCDGELPMYIVNQKRAKINKQLHNLFQVWGREVDETTVYDWLEQRKNAK